MSLFKLMSPKVYIDLVLTTRSRVIPIDATWFMPNSGKNAKEEFLKGPRLQGAVFFDVDGCTNAKSPYPHMLPDLETFNDYMSSLGLLPSDTLVVYDKIGNFSSPRVAWTLAVMGHPKVYLLNSFHSYVKYGETEEFFQLETVQFSRPERYPRSSYKSTKTLLDKEVLSFEELEALVSSQKLGEQYNAFDARSMGRYTGVDPEPRAGLPSGHVPMTQPLPYSEVLDPQTKEFLEPELLKAKILAFFKANDVKFDENKPIITMCGTGVSGAIIKTALEVSGLSKSPIKLYDGSWTEWASRVNTSEEAAQKFICKGRD